MGICIIAELTSGCLRFVGCMGGPVVFDCQHRHCVGAEVADANSAEMTGMAWATLWVIQQRCAATIHADNVHAIGAACRFENDKANPVLAETGKHRAGGPELRESWLATRQGACGPPVE